MPWSAASAAELLRPSKSTSRALLSANAELTAVDLHQNSLRQSRWSRRHCWHGKKMRQDDADLHPSERPSDGDILSLTEKGINRCHPRSSDCQLQKKILWSRQALAKPLSTCWWQHGGSPSSNPWEVGMDSPENWGSYQADGWKGPLQPPLARLPSLLQTADHPTRSRRNPRNFQRNPRTGHLDPGTGHVGKKRGWDQPWRNIGIWCCCILGYFHTQYQFVVPKCSQIKPLLSIVKGWGTHPRPICSPWHSSWQADAWPPGDDSCLAGDSSTDLACWASNSFNDKAKTACSSSSSLAASSLAASLRTASLGFLANPPARIKLPSAFSAAAWPLRRASPSTCAAFCAAWAPATAVRRAVSAAAALATSATAPAWGWKRWKEHTTKTYQNKDKSYVNDCGCKMM